MATKPLHPSRSGDTHEAMMKLLGKKLLALGFHSYADFLQSERWQKRRSAWWKKHPKALCFICSSRATQLHHRTYTRLGREKDGDLRALCGDCHQAVHEFAKSDRRFGAAVERYRRQFIREQMGS